MSQPLASYNIGQPFIVLQSIESTNNYALQQIHEGLAQPGAAVFAREQTAGRGQHGKIWKSEPLQNIILSVILRPAAPFSGHAFPLSCALALGLYDFFSPLAGDETRIKWPNDLYWRDRKAGGILIDTIMSNHQNTAPVLEWAVVGMGVNINQTEFAEMERRPVSLRQITGRSFNPEELSKDLCNCLQRRYRELAAGALEAQLESYNNVLFKKNEKVRLRQGMRTFETVIRSVNAAGELLTGENSEFVYSHGQVVWQ